MTDIGITQARVLTVETRSYGKEETERLLDLAKSRSNDPSVFDEFEPYFFGGEISSNRWDSYDTRMMPSTLKNYAEEATAGVAYLKAHNSREDPTGATLDGKFVGGQGGGIPRVNATFYILRSAGNEEHVLKIRSGIVRDLSVGFFGGEWRCTICGKDMMDWSRDGCFHLLGFKYTPKDESGTARGEAVVARAEIEDAHLAEVSGVYEGATPGAMITKARELHSEGLLNEREQQFVRIRYRTSLPDLGKLISGVTLEVEPKEERVSGLKDGEVTPVELDWTRVRELLKARGMTVTDEKSTEELVRSVLKDRDELVPLADMGRQYKADLIEETLAEGVRAQGNEFKLEEYKGILSTLNLDQIKRFKSDWSAIADSKLNGGRATVNGEGEKGENGEGETEERAENSKVRRLPARAHAS